MQQYQVTAVVVVVVIVAILAQLELESEPLIAKRTVLLTASKDETFRTVTDLKTFKKWMSFVVLAAEDADDTSPVKMGKPFRLYLKTPFKPLEMQGRITNHLPISSFGFEAKSFILSIKSTFEIEDGDNAGFSRLTWKIHSKRKSFLYLVTVVQPLKLILSHQVTASLFNLKIIMHYD